MSKHLLTTKSDKIILSKGFEDYFELDGNQLIFTKDENECKNLYIKMNLDDFNVDLDEFSLEYQNINSNNNDDDFVVAEELQINKFYITDEDGSNIDKLFIENDIYMNISDSLYELIQKYSKGHKKKILIPLSAIEENDTLFTVDINNAELTKTLNLVKDLFEKKDHLGCKTIDEMVQRLVDLLIEGKIYSNIVHCEILVRNLIRSVNDEFKFPDLEKGEEYEILTVKKALMNHPSPLLSLGFERIKEQIKGTLLFKKHGNSIFDNLFKEAYKKHYDLKEKDFVA